jgi:hypothetical protein
MRHAPLSGPIARIAEEGEEADEESKEDDEESEQKGERLKYQGR